MPKECRPLRGAWLLLCVFAFTSPLLAGTAEQSESPFIVDGWSTKQRLPGSAVISLIQTRDGYLWLGTQYGLVRFDGVHFTVFDEGNTPGLNNDQIDYLFEDSHTNLWIGTDGGGVTLDTGGALKNFTLGRSGREGRLVSACEDSTGTVWFYTADAHLGRYQNGKMEVWDFHFKTPAITRMLAAEKSGILWIGEGWVDQERNVSLLFSFRPANVSPPAFAIDQQIPVERLDYILASQRGGTWRLMNGQIQKWGPNQLERNWGTYPWGNLQVFAACEDPAGNLIVGTRGAGVFWFEPDGNYRQISTAQGLSSPYVLSLCLDRTGNLWVGTDGGGLDRVKRKIFNTPDGVHPWDAQSLAGDAGGGLWAAFFTHGATYWRTNVARDFGVGQGSNAWTVLVDHQQRVWAGTWDEGLFQFDKDRFLPAPDAEILHSQISVLFEDKAGHLWAGTPNGLGLWNGQSWKTYTTRDGLSGNVISALAEDAADNLWIGTKDGGLTRLQAGKFYVYPATDNGPSGNDISCLYVDQGGSVWVGTSGHGLARFHDGKWTRYSTRDGLVSDSISYLIADDTGDLWIGSNQGLMRVPRTLLDTLTRGTLDFSACRIYSESDGLPTLECSSGSQPAAASTTDGRLWFPTTRGLAYLDPAELKPNLLPPQVMIESVLVDGQEQKTNRLDSAWPPAITIPPDGEQLEIDYTALNFSAPELVRFKYILDGHESAWTDAKADRVARFPKLPPGHYTFHVKACNEDYVWSDPAAAVLFITVQPQFWQTGWFRVASIVVVLGIVAAIVRYVSTQKLQRQLQAHRQRETLEQERSRIARDLHDQLGANLTQVALLGEMAETDRHSPEEIASHAHQISQTARETTHALDEIVWAVNPSNDTLDGLITYACKYAQEYLALAGLRYRAEVPPQLPAVVIPPEVRHNVFLAFKEAVNNVVKHARATEARIRLRLQPGNFILEIEDDGRGVGQPDSTATRTRNGLRNMRKRMEDIHGEFAIARGVKGGTIVRLAAPLNLK